MNQTSETNATATAADALPPISAPHALTPAQKHYLGLKDELATLRDELMLAQQRKDEQHAARIVSQIGVAQVGCTRAKQMFLVEREAGLVTRLGVLVSHLELIQADLNAVRGELAKMAA